MQSISDYIVELNPACFERHEFQDVSKFKEWLLREREETEEDTNYGVFQFVYSVVQEMTQFRFHAEEHFKENNHIAENKRKELPIPAEEIKSKYFDEQKEPPETVVSRIAQNQIHVIDAVLLKVRKVLRRERELTRIANVQQLDSQCLIWLTRQPGVTAAQKAGTKQKLMSIVRKENYDILENRVLKAVLKLCSSYCQRYLRQYGKDFPDSLRIKAVKRLYSSAQIGLKQEVMGSISLVHGIPKPNYVLLHDQQYSQIWQMYLDLLHQTSLMEHAWRNRHKLLQQYFLFCFANVSQFEYGLLFNSNFWISTDIKNNGHFIKNSYFRRIFTVGNSIGQFIPRSESPCKIPGDAELKLKSKCHNVSFAYLPADVALQGVQMTDRKNHTYFIFSEVPLDSQANKTNNVLIKTDMGLFFQLDDWFVNFTGGQR